MTLILRTAAAVELISIAVGTFTGEAAEATGTARCVRPGDPLQPALNGFAQHTRSSRG